MKTELSYFDIYPKVIPENKKVTICINSLGSRFDFCQDKKYTIQILPINEGEAFYYPNRKNLWEYEKNPDADGCIRIEHTFASEQEYFVCVKDKENDNNNVQLSVYAVKEDLQGRYPYIGDLHIHTLRSDGREKPSVVAANYRKAGYDFIVISDHRRYYPSLEAIEAYRDVPIDLVIVPGEEIHLPDNDVHIVNFGSDYSVNGLLENSCQNNEMGDAKAKRSTTPAVCPDVISIDEYKHQVTELAKTLDIPDNIEAFTYASCVWIFEHIRKGNGLSIFCHPCWKRPVFQVPASFTEYMLKQKPFCAFEVVGGELYYHQNGYQTQLYYDAKAQGNIFPVVGSSDSHCSVNNPKAQIGKTIVFSPENEKNNLITSIKNFYSVAVDNLGEEYKLLGKMQNLKLDYRLVGETRLIKYSAFLLENYFDLHDELCFEEGNLMKEYSCTGSEESKKGLNNIAGRTKKLQQKYFLF